MRLVSKVTSILAAASCLGVAAPASASIDGWFDAVDVGMVDTAHGWVCDNWNPYHTPHAGVLSVYVNGSHHSDFALNSNNWGFDRPDAAHRCNGYSAIGYSLMSWYWQGAGTKVDVYFKHNTGFLQQLGKTITLTQPGRNLPPP